MGHCHSHSVRHNKIKQYLSHTHTHTTKLFLACCKIYTVINTYDGDRTSC